MSLSEWAMLQAKYNQWQKKMLRQLSRTELKKKKRTKRSFAQEGEAIPDHLPQL